MDITTSSLKNPNSSQWQSITASATMQPSVPNLLVPVSMTTIQLPAKPKKKRIRRQKLELEYLRTLVVQLEAQMSSLKAKHPQAATIKDVAKIEAKAPSLWKGVAERQLEARTRVEEKNRKLRLSLEGQLKLDTKLKGLLRKWPRQEELAALAGVKRFKPWATTLVSPTDDEIFADQLAHVQRAHQEMDRLFSKREFLDTTTSFCNLHLLDDSQSDTGVAFVKTASSMLPFDVRVTEKAFWRALAEEGTKKDSYFLEERLTTENVVARSYGLHFRADAFHANVMGKQTYRKHVDGDRIVIMWKWIVDPVEVNGTKFHGLRCHETGWIMLRGVNLVDRDNSSFAHSANSSRPVISTLLQSYSKMTMELRDDIARQELQVGELADFVVNLHDAITEACGKMISNVLIEEDWNLNGWLLS